MRKMIYFAKKPLELVEFNSLLAKLNLNELTILYIREEFSIYSYEAVNQINNILLECKADLFDFENNCPIGFIGGNFSPGVAAIIGRDRAQTSVYFISRVPMLLPVYFSDGDFSHWEYI